MPTPADPHPPRDSRFSAIYARLAELPNYVWDSDIAPFHSVRLAAYLANAPG